MDELERAYEWIGQAAHDLRNPIAIIVGASTLLRRQWDRLTEELRREQVDAIASHALRLSELAEALLDWAAAETGKVIVHLEDVDVRPVVEAAVQSELPGSPVEIRVPDISAIADPTHLGRVISNLLANARKYGAPPYRVEGTESNGELVLSIADYGPGVPDEIADRLFDPFVRGASGSDGAGLGLAIVRGLVEAQGGRVWYHRDEGMSRFSIALRKPA
jgi:two-component system sensor histidine kinase KdpD